MTRDLSRGNSPKKETSKLLGTYYLILYKFGNDSSNYYRRNIKLKKNNIKPYERK